MSNNCRVVGCKRREGDLGAHFFRLPKDEARCKLWKTALGIGEGHRLADVPAETCHKNMRVCNIHFEDHCYSSMQNNRLKKNALPTKFLNFDTPTVATSNQGNEHINIQPINKPIVNLAQIQPGIAYIIQIAPNMPSRLTQISNNDEVTTSIKQEVIEPEQFSLDDIKLEALNKIEIDTDYEIKYPVKLEVPSPDNVETETGGLLLSNLPLEIKSEAQDAELLAENVPPCLRDPSSGVYPEIRVCSPDVKGIDLDLITQFESQLQDVHQSINISEDTPISEHLKICLEASNNNKQNIKESDKTSEQESWSKNIITFLRFVNDIKKRNRFTHFAMALYLRDPILYKYLMMFVDLPSEGDLKKKSRRWRIEPGFTTFVTEALKIKINSLKMIDKDCLICFKEMKLNSRLFYNIQKDEIIGFESLGWSEKTCNVAEYAIVVMVKGILHNWKLPVAYYFTTSTTTHLQLKNILIECIKNLEKLGLKIFGVVSDLSSKFCRLFTENLGVSPSKPYFLIDNTAKTNLIYCFFHTPQLVIDTRNAFFDQTFQTSNGDAITSKVFFQEVFWSDIIHGIPNPLNDKHLNALPTKNYKLAAGIFQKAVVDIMNVALSFETVPKSAIDTIKFLEKMALLLEILNVGKQRNKPFKYSDSEENALKEIRNYFEHLKINTSDTNERLFIFGWRITISGFLNLWNELKIRGHPYINTRHIRQDSINVHFQTISKRCGKKPTAIKFSRAFRDTFCEYYFKPWTNSKKMIDFGEIESFFTQDYIKQMEVLFKVDKYVYLDVGVSDYVSLYPLPNNNLENMNVAKYLIKKCLLMHSCETCLKYSSQILYNILALLTDLEKKFVSTFPVVCVRSSVGLHLKSELVGTLSRNKNELHPCCNFDFEYFLTLYTRVRIHYTLKCTNRHIANTKQPRLVVAL